MILGMKSELETPATPASDRFSLVAGSVASLAGLWYVAAVLTAVPVRPGPGLVGIGLILMGLTMVAEGVLPRARRPLFIGGMLCLLVSAIWFQTP